MMDRQVELRNNVIFDFVWKLYLNLTLTFNYWLLVLTRLFVNNNIETNQTSNVQNIIRPKREIKYESELNDRKKESAFELAINFANKAEFDSLITLFKSEQKSIEKHCLVILKNLPETISPLKYEELLNNIFLTLDKDLNTKSKQKLEIIYKEEQNSSLKNENLTLLQLDEFESTFYQNHPDYKNYIIQDQLNKNLLTQWFKDRAIEILVCTALVDNSLELLKFGIDRSLPLEDLYTQLDIYSLLLYENNQYTVPFDKFECLTLTGKLNLILSNQEAIYALENLFNKFIQKLTYFKHSSQLDVNKKIILRDFLVNLAKTNFEQCLKIFESCSMVNKTLEEIRSYKIINDACELIELAIECICAYDKPSCLNMAFRIMECLPDRCQADILMEGDAARIRHFNRINDRADQVEYYLSMIEVLCDYNTHITVKELDSIINLKDAKSSELFLNKVIKNFCSARLTNVDISTEWKNFLWNLEDLRKTCLSSVTPEKLIEMSVNNLLFSANKTLIELALGHINFNSNKTSTKKLQYEKGKEMLMKTANDYIQFSNPIQDDNLELAKVCLQIFKKQNNVENEILEELDLIEGLKIMYNEFKFDLLPIKVKQSGQPRIHLIEALLKKSKSAYTKVSKVIQLSKLLRVCVHYSDKYREGVVLSLIGKEAIQNQDYKAAYEICQTILEHNLQDGWDLCYLFAKLPIFYLDDEQQQIYTSNQQISLLSFSLAYCPESNVDIHFEIINQIKSTKSSLKTNSNSNLCINFKGEISVK